ncbi:MAG: ArsR family transcriptional regulator [Methanoregula sp.]|nr:ArsR family transcriptional regulator [Methanoregula sp.]
MRTETVMYFTEKEEEFTDLLIKIGTRKNVAKVLVFLAKTPEASSRAIEWGTDLRQPEVSVAMRYLIGLNWIKSRESRVETRGRPMMVYGLAKPTHEIIDRIEAEKNREAKAHLKRVHKLRDYLC